MKIIKARMVNKNQSFENRQMPQNENFIILEGV